MTIDLHLQHPNIVANCGSNAERLHCRLQRITAYLCSFYSMSSLFSQKKRWSSQYNICNDCFLQDDNNKALLFLEATSRSGEGAVV